MCSERYISFRQELRVGENFALELQVFRVTSGDECGIFYEYGDDLDRFDRV